MIIEYLVPLAVGTAVTIVTFFAALAIHSRQQEKMYRRSLNHVEFEKLMRELPKVKGAKSQVARARALERKWMARS